MKNAYISIVDSRDGLEKAHSLLIDQWYEGISDYKPLCTAQLVYLKGEGFLARLYCREAEPRVTVACEDGPVYKDSCLEWFCNFAPERSDIYMNMEVNAAGRMLCRLGSGRQNRQPLPETAPRPRVCASREEGGWSLELFVPLATVKAVWGKEDFASGDTISGVLTNQGIKYTQNKENGIAERVAREMLFPLASCREMQQPSSF